METIESKPILITGIERSGSSIVAKIIGLCGTYTGSLTKMNENINLKNLVSHLYCENELDPRGQFPIPVQPYISLYTYNWKDSTLSAIHKDGYKKDIPWMYKSSRIGQMWPVWNESYPEARWVIVRRRTGDIIQSCFKTGFMTAFKDKGNLQKINAVNEAEGWMWWIHEQEQRFIEMEKAGLNMRIVWPERMAEEDFTQIKEVVEWLGLQWNENIPDLVHPLFANSKQKERE